MTDHAGARAAIDGFEAESGAIDILVNNAGMQFRAPLEDFPADAFAMLLQTNVASVFNVGQACARHMIARRAGKIINIASVQTALARPSIAPYTATKGAVGNLTKGMCTDWARYGLQCNAIAPGVIATAMSAGRMGSPFFERHMLETVPLPVPTGEPDDIGEAVAYLASSRAPFINGQVIAIDGGWSTTHYLNDAAIAR